MNTKMNTKFTASLDGAVMHIQMSNPDHEQLTWNNETGGPNEKPIFFEFEFSTGERVAMTIAVMQELKKEGIEDIKPLVEELFKTLNRKAVH